MLYFKTGLYDLNTLTAEILMSWTGQNSVFVILRTDHTELFVVLFKCSCKCWSQISHVACYYLIHHNASHFTL